ncbi:MAG: DUF4363 family protein [Clostridia bacterium]|nr:DUF4363 family protein [Clostridia bacterium]
MKRVYLAIGLLITAVALCVASLLYQQTRIDRLLGQVDTLENAYEKGQTEVCIRQAEQLAEAYERCARLFSCFMSHNELNDSLDSVVTLAACLKEDNPEEFLLELAKFRQQLIYMRQIEVPHISNIL